MLVKEIAESKPRKPICEFHRGEVFKYDRYWFMVVDANFDYVTNWDKFCNDNINNPLGMDWKACEVTPCVRLDIGIFCFLGDYWYADDYGTAEIHIAVTSCP